MRRARVTGDGVTGRWMAEQQPYDVVVLDIMLPRRHGYEAPEGVGPSTGGNGGVVLGRPARRAGVPRLVGCQRSRGQPS